MIEEKRVERFEDLIAWQKARLLTAEIYRVTSQGHFARDFGLRDQICRAAVSVMSNIAESFERTGQLSLITFSQSLKLPVARFAPNSTWPWMPLT